MHLRHYLGTKESQAKGWRRCRCNHRLSSTKLKPGAVKGTLDIAIAVIINFIGRDTTCQIATVIHNAVAEFACTRVHEVAAIITIGIISNMVLRLRAG